MKAKKYRPARRLHEIGQIAFPIEKTMAAREASCVCVGVDARW